MGQDDRVRSFEEVCREAQQSLKIFEASTTPEVAKMAKQLSNNIVLLGIWINPEGVPPKVYPPMGDIFEYASSRIGNKFEDLKNTQGLSQDEQEALVHIEKAFLNLPKFDLKEFKKVDIQKLALLVLTLKYRFGLKDGDIEMALAVLVSGLFPVDRTESRELTFGLVFHKIVSEKALVTVMTTKAGLFGYLPISFEEVLRVVTEFE